MKNKYVASTLAFTLGIWGVHRFYLGQRFRGFFQFGFGIASLMLSIALEGPFIVIPALIAFIEAVLFLAMPKVEFDEKYNKKYLAFTRSHQQQAYYDGAAYREEPGGYRDERRAYREREERREYREAPRRARRPESRRKTANPYKSSGVAKFNDYDYDGAIHDFKKALRHKYDDPSLHFNLACCYSINEAADEAFFHLDKAVGFGFVDFDKIQKHNSLAFVRTEDQYEQFVRNGYRIIKSEAEASQEETAPAVDKRVDLSGDLLDQIVKLGELREKGILTDEEFQIQKQKLMNRN